MVSFLYIKYTIVDAVCKYVYYKYYTISIYSSHKNTPQPLPTKITNNFQP